MESVIERIVTAHRYEFQEETLKNIFQRKLKIPMPQYYTRKN